MAIEELALEVAIGARPDADYPELDAGRQRAHQEWRALALAVGLDPPGDSSEQPT